MKININSFLRSTFLIVTISLSISSCEKDDQIPKKDVVIIWENPSDILYGTPLSEIQLNATADVPGTFIYTPQIGTVLNAGTAQNLKVDFTPNDTENFNKATKSVIINVKALSIGDSYQGGKIAYIFQIGDPGYVAGQTHGLIVSDTILGEPTWYNGAYTNTGATGTVLGSGITNTNAIIASQGNTGTYAAKLCRDYRGGGFDDWFLPSKDELNLLYLNKAAIGHSSAYWSSSEYNNNNAWGQYFVDGNKYLNGKNSGSRVIAVRTF